MPWIPCNTCRGYLLADETGEELPAVMIAPAAGTATMVASSDFGRPAGHPRRTWEERADPSPAAVPAAEMERVKRALSGAAACADSGRPATGYVLLVRELARAEDLLAAGAQWAGELLATWRDAIDRYGVCFQDEIDSEEHFPQRETASC